jgi:hypothetical protein
MSGLCSIDEAVVREIVPFQDEIYRFPAEPEVQQAYCDLEPRFAVVRESGTKKNRRLDWSSAQLARSNYGPGHRLKPSGPRTAQQATRPQRAGAGAGAIMGPGQKSLTTSGNPTPPDLNLPPM